MSKDDNNKDQKHDQYIEEINVMLKSLPETDLKKVCSFTKIHYNKNRLKNL